MRCILARLMQRLITSEPNLKLGAQSHPRTPKGLQFQVAAFADAAPSDPCPAGGTMSPFIDY